jgi:hypothetical protein
MLVPEPTERPTIDNILRHRFSKCISILQGSLEIVSKSAGETPEKLAFSTPKEKMTVSFIYKNIEKCIALAPKVLFNPEPIIAFPLFVSKWINYSNRFGFGFQLSDKSAGVLFNRS